jgi:hypothetical protein
MTVSEKVRRTRGVVAAFSLSLAWAGIASADPTQGDRADARAAMAEGRQLRSQKNYDAALKSFRTADGIMHVPTTGLEVARTLEAMGRLVEARSTLRRVLSLQISPTDPAPFQDAMATAAILFTELEERTPMITFVVQSTAQGVPLVWVDGQPVPPSELANPLLLDPGTHQIMAHLGKLDATQTIDLHERDRQPVVLKMPVVAPKAAPEKPSPWRTVAYASFGTSAAGLVIGTITGALALSTKHTAESGCNGGQCPPATWDALDRAHSYATVSTVGFATFGAALGLGFASLALAPPKEGAPSGSIPVRPSVGGLSPAAHLSVGGLSPAAHLSVGIGYAQIEGSF